MMNVSRLSFEGLRCSYGFDGLKHECPFDDLHFDIQAGKVVTVRGGNGSGKSSLIKTILGVIPSSSGVVKTEFYDKGLNSESYPVGEFRERCGLTFGYLPQRIHDMFPPANQVSTVLKWYSAKNAVTMDRKRLVAFEEEMGMARVISRVKHRHCGQVSPGEAQKLGLYAILLKSPDVVLLDEPTASLDATDEAWEIACTMIKAMRGTNERGLKFVLISTHDKRVMEKICEQEVSLAGSSISRKKGK
ncbi:MAG: ATP-binding cassette domain-containing protein [Planctomycetaceae bacterium]